MTDEPAKLPKAFWQIPIWILLLIAIGNGIMLVIENGKLYSFEMFILCSVNSVVIGGAFMIGLKVIVTMLDKRVPWLRYPQKRLLYQFLVTLLFSCMVIIISVLLINLLAGQKITSGIFFEQSYFMAKIAFLFVFWGTVISNAVIFFKNWKESAVQQEILKREQLALQYETLKSQVNPHFLFNNLNSLTSLIHSNPGKAIDFVKKLSEVYRYVLDQKNQELVPLETELRFVESYIYLHKIRFGSNLMVQIDVDSQEFKVIPLSVQLLVENAIKHNEISDKKPLLIKVYTNNEQYLVVENLLQKKSGTEGSGTGLQNISARYGFFSDKKVLITFNSETFRVNIPLLTD
jgi:LytS/YehU family sensor histidine kinase